MKKITLLLIIVAAVTFAGCQKKSASDAVALPATVAETGTVIDVTEKNGQSVTVVPGDVIYVKLTGEAASGNQWSVVSPVSDDLVSLKDHVITGLTDKNAPDKKFTDEWKIKIERTGSFDLEFSYGRPGESPKETFKVSVTSQ